MTLIWLMLAMLASIEIEGTKIPNYYTYTGYTLVTQLSVTNCTTNITSQINKAWTGDASILAIEIPKTNANLPHVSCHSDSVMGNVPQFTIYQNDNDPVTGYADRQRIEMKVFEPSPASYKAVNNTDYIYSWWFQLDKSLIAADGFFHIFQIKAVGTNVDDSPLFTFTLTVKDGLQFRVRRDDHITTDTYPMVPLSSVLGKWTQAYVESSFQEGNSLGYFRVMLKDLTGNLLYSGKVNNDNWWNQASFYRPKWGLYRKISATFQKNDTENFQNVQIWKRNF